MALVMRLLGHCRLVALHRASACARSCSKLGHTVVVIPALWVRALLFASAAALVSAASALIASFGRTPCQLSKTRARGTRGGKGHPQSRARTLQLLLCGARTLQLLLCGVLGCSVVSGSVLPILYLRAHRHATPTRTLLQESHRSSSLRCREVCQRAPPSQRRRSRSLRHLRGGTSFAVFVPGVRQIN